MPETASLGADPRELRRLFEERVTTESLRSHSLETEAIMRHLAERLGEDEDLWGWAGLLHDLDFEETKDQPHRHGLMTAQVLEQLGVNPQIVRAIKAHNAEALGLARETSLDCALTCAETVTGLISATALVQPDKKLAGVQVNSLRKKMKDKAFARNVNRELILLCENLGLEQDEFLALSLLAMKEIAGHVGL